MSEDITYSVTDAQGNLIVPPTVLPGPFMLPVPRPRPDDRQAPQ